MYSHTSPFQRSSREQPQAALDPQAQARQQEVVQLLKQVVEPILKADIVR